MSRKLRTNFAAPLVVTLAALPGCVVRSGPAPAARAGDGAPTTVVSNPPRVTYELTALGRSLRLRSSAKAYRPKRDAKRASRASAASLCCSRGQH